MLGEAIAAALPELQAHAESLMVDTCRVDRRAGDDEWVIVDGIEQPVPPVTVYEGKCKVQSYIPYESTPDVGGSTATIQRLNIHLPVGTQVVPGDLLAIVESASPGLVGREFRVAVRAPYKTWRTSERVYVDELS